MAELKNLSVKKTFFCIVAVTAVAVILLSAASVQVCSAIRDQILLSHAFVKQPAVIDSEESGSTMIVQPVVVKPDEDGGYAMNTEKSGISEEGAGYTNWELTICRVIQMLIIFLPVLFSFMGIGCAGSIFWQVKLKGPLAALRQGISHIAENDLSFSIACGQQDELGRLCAAFETMRRELLNNNRRMWEVLEERKKINASISHDLRTPITVIKGYSEYLDRNVGRDVLTEGGMREIAAYIHQAADRLEKYANSVHEVQTLEDMSLDYKEMVLSDLMKEMQSQLSILSKQHGTEINLSARLPEQTVSIASAAVFRIVENIVSNSLRYCKSQIDVNFSYSQPFLTITVTDDGQGFSAQDQAEALNYFYKGRKEKEHFGIGLTICRILAKKHGGTIFLDNAPEGGARVTVKLKM